MSFTPAAAQTLRHVSAEGWVEYHAAIANALPPAIRQEIAGILAGWGLS